MKTARYQAIRAINQLLVVIILFSNTFVLVYAITDRYLWNIEVNAMDLKNITFYGIGLYTICVNLIIALFTGCGITSGRKFIMYVYNKLVVLSILINTFFCLFFKTLYLSSFSHELGMQTGRNASFANIVRTATNSISTDDAVIIVKSWMETSLWIYLSVQVTTIVANIIIYITTRMAMKIELVKEETPEPTYVAFSRLGLNTESLSTRKAVEVVI